ncbi:MAG: hypothetical protein L0271_01395 [Gemmatimonadetes bacterium]|nr:hypothetical protein [Gemmatimonadota bacterium]
MMPRKETDGIDLATRRSASNACAAACALAAFGCADELPTAPVRPPPPPPSALAGLVGHGMAWAIIAAVLLGSPGCDDPMDANEATGEIALTIITTGVEIDANGYSIQLRNGSSRSIGPNATTTFTRLAPGQYTLLLGDLAANCALQGDPGPVGALGPVAVLAGQTTSVTLTVVCTATTGSLRVTFSTAGVDLTRNHYLVSIRRWTSRGTPLSRQVRVPVNGTILIDRVPIGLVTLTLDEVPPNCDERDGFRREPRVASDDTVGIDFDLVCVPVTRLLYVKTGSNHERDIAISNANGAGENLLTVHPARDIDPAWSPDRSRIAFATDRDGNFEIYAMDDDGSNPIRLTSHPAHDHSPNWSPDGTKIAFIRDHSTGVGGGSIWVMNAGGSNAIQLTAPQFDRDAFDVDPVWSPDGQRIAFSRFERGLTPGIYSMRSDGSEVRRLSSHQPGAMTGQGVIETERHPAWSPDGSRIAFARYVCAYGDYGCYETITVKALDGREDFLPVTGSEPAWSVDGRHIAYTATSCDLYFSVCRPEGIRIVRADGSSDFGLGIVGTGPAWR